MMKKGGKRHEHLLTDAFHRDLLLGRFAGAAQAERKDGAQELDLRVPQLARHNSLLHRVLCAVCKYLGVHQGGHEVRFCHRHVHLCIRDAAVVLSAQREVQQKAAHRQSDNHSRRTYIYFIKQKSLKTPAGNSAREISGKMRLNY